MKTKIKYAIKEYFKLRFENRDDVQLDAWDMMNVSLDVQIIINNISVWNVINPDDESTFPDDDRLVLMSFENFSVPVNGRFENGTFYIGDSEESCLEHDLIVNAWMELPKCYKENNHGDQ